MPKPAIYGFYFKFGGLKKGLKNMGPRNWPEKNPKHTKFGVLENGKTVFDFRPSVPASLHQHLREENKAMKTRVLETVGVQRLEED
jgi:hypothetical protein